MQFQKDQSGKAAGAGRAIQRAPQCTPPRISLLFPCSPLLFSAEIQVLRVFLPIFQLARPLCRDLQARMECTLGVRHLAANPSKFQVSRVGDNLHG